MVRPRQRKKVKNALTKVTRRRPVAKKSAVLDATLAKHWDSTKTTEQNFRQTGLASRINGDIGLRVSKARLEEWNERRMEAVLSGALQDYDSEDEMVQELRGVFVRAPAVETEAVRDLERAAAQPADTAPAKRQLAEADRLYISRLHAKHGEDYERMFWDPRLNTRQLTAVQLARLAARL